MKADYSESIENISANYYMGLQHGHRSQRPISAAEGFDFTFGTPRSKFLRVLVLRTYSSLIHGLGHALMISTSALMILEWLCHGPVSDDLDIVFM